jgi:cytochrome P450
VAAQAFTRERVESMRLAVGHVVAGLLDAMAEEGSPAGLGTRLSVPLPHLTICELLAVPEEDREDLRACTMRLLPPHPVPDLRLAVCPEEVRWDTETISRFLLRLPVTW